MTSSNCYAAVDIGASSGRVVVGTVQDGRIELPKFTASITSKNDQAVMTAGISKCCSAKLLRD